MGTDFDLLRVPQRHSGDRYAFSNRNIGDSDAPRLCTRVAISLHSRQTKHAAGYVLKSMWPKMALQVSAFMVLTAAIFKFILVVAIKIELHAYKVY